MILLLTQINAMAQDLPKINRPQIILKRFEDAPFTGVLVPPDIYKKISADLLLRDEFETRLKQCLTDRTRLVNFPQPEDYRWSFLLLGFATGFVLSSVLNK